MYCDTKLEKSILGRRELKPRVKKGKLGTTNTLSSNQIFKCGHVDKM